MFEALITCFLLFSGLTGEFKSHYDCSQFSNEGELYKEFQQDNRGMSYDDFKKAFYAEVAAKKGSAKADGGISDTLGAD